MSAYFKEKNPFVTFPLSEKEKNLSRFELGQGDLSGNIIKGNYDRHFDFYIFRLAADYIAFHSRSLSKLNDGQNIRYVIFKSRMVRYAVYCEAIYRSFPAEFNPLAIQRVTSGTKNTHREADVPAPVTFLHP
jgi:hypothetical protein